MSLEAHLSQSIGRLFTYTNANSLNIISALIIDDLGCYWYNYYNLEFGKIFNAPCWLFTESASAARGVIWLTPVKTVNTSNK